VGGRACHRPARLIWDQSWWNRSGLALLPIFVLGCLWFFLAAKFAIERRSLRAKVLVPAVLFSLAVAPNGIGFGLLGWNY
jgi:hypothetical protein